MLFRDFPGLGGGVSLDSIVSPPEADTTAEALFSRAVYLPNIQTSVGC